MATDQIRFDDGAAYERYMGKWSQLVGETFLDWLAPKPGLRWLDVGCGNGAFTEMLVERCAPVSVDGIDPSEAQLAYARTRPATRVAQFRQGDAMALPFADDAFDAAVMPLVIFFVPDPAKSIGEMARVVCPGGSVLAYAWDMPGGGFPYEALWAQMRAMGAVVPRPPNQRECANAHERERAWLGNLRSVAKAYGRAVGLGEPIAVGIVVSVDRPTCHGIGSVLGGRICLRLAVGGPFHKILAAGGF